VLKRVKRRLIELDLGSLDAYRRRLEADPEEWRRLDAMCRVTISRFFRDHGVWAALLREVLPALAAERRHRALRAWSAGCASGEEAHTLSIAWALGVERPADTRLEVVATDVDPHLLARARRGIYPAGSLRELPEPWRRAAFAPAAAPDHLALRSPFRAPVRFEVGDLRADAPAGRFDLVLCRYAAFTYLDDEGRREVLARLLDHLEVGGALVLGTIDVLPEDPRLAPWGVCPAAPIWRRV
jgi:chemotaxis protein methyltransferase CheR